MNNIIVKSRTQYVITVVVNDLLVKSGTEWIADKTICLLADINSTLSITAKQPRGGWIGVIQIKYTAGANEITVFYPDSMERDIVKLPDLIDLVDLLNASPFQVARPTGIAQNIVFAPMITDIKIHKA